MTSIKAFRPAQLAAVMLVTGLGTVAPVSFAQSPATSASPTNPSAGMVVAPGKTEAPDSAFKKLDPSAKGFVSKNDAAQVQGFDAAFQQADANKDGRLSPSEFNQAWTIYSGTSK